MLFQQITLVGMGLLGGSLGLASKERRLAARVYGYARRQATVAECERLAVADQVTLDLPAAVAEADLVVLCTPIAQMQPLTEKLLPAMKRGAIVTDVGSVKGSVVCELESVVAEAGGRFVGSHPMAGAEKNGVSAARADLFVDAVCAITPTRRTDASALKQVVAFWRALGASPLELSPERHDDLVGRGSHLPHVVAAELVNYILSPIHPPEQAKLCANGFRDTTRIASGSPEMWRDIALANRKNLARVLGVFIEDLQEFRHGLDVADSKSVEEFFRKAKQRRDGWCNPGNSSE